jgi:hypothetical protein
MIMIYIILAIIILGLVFITAFYAYKKYRNILWNDKVELKDQCLVAVLFGLFTFLLFPFLYIIALIFDNDAVFDIITFLLFCLAGLVFGVSILLVMLLRFQLVFGFRNKILPRLIEKKRK